MAAWGRLRVLDGAHEGTVFVLEREVHTLGRGQASDFRLADPTVSRVQAEFRNTSEGVRISGLSDRNPVWVNGEPAGRGRPLLLGDKVQCGLVHLVFEEPPAPVRAAPPPATGGEGLAMTLGGPASMLRIPAAPPAPGAPTLGPMGPSCGRCGAKESPGARFCGSCGAALSGSAAPLPTSVTRTPAPPPRHPEPPPPSTGDIPQPVIHTDTMARPPEGLDGPDAPGAFRRGTVPLAAGVVLKGRYELRRHIAQGRVTEVYEGLDRETKATITVKVLHLPLSADLEVRDWFFHAANALVVAPHPRLLRVHSVHEADPYCFVVTDFLVGVPLRDQIRSRPDSMGGFDPAEVRRVGTALCEGLARLHDVGPHGDVVPGNVWLDPQGNVTLLDAGLSAVPGKAVRWPPASDLAAAVYAAPEVLKGAPPDARSDLYSVGAILYHMLTMDLPAGRIPSVAVARPGLPPDLALAVDRAMSPRAADRFASAKEMLRHLTGEMEASRSSYLRRRFLATGSAAALLLAAVSSVLWFPPATVWRRRRFADPEAVVRALDRKAEAAGVEAVLRGTLAGFADAGGLERARDALRLGEEAREAWLPEEADLHYAEALRILRDEEKGARERKFQHVELGRKAEAAHADLEAVLAGAPSAGKFLDEAAAAFAKEADKVPLPAEGESGPPRVETMERQAALRYAKEVAGRLRDRWEASASGGDAVTRARREDEAARDLLGKGEPAAAEKAFREAGLSLRRGLGEEMEAILRGLCDEARIPLPPEAEGLRKDLAAISHRGKAGDWEEAASAYERAMEGFPPAVLRALEGARAAAEAREKGRRCAECAGAGLCRACGGSGQAGADCGKCGARGFLPVVCIACKGTAAVACPGCAGTGKVRETCPRCAGRKSTLCEKCRGEPVKCESCSGTGVRDCLRCHGDGIMDAAGEKGKPCVQQGCIAGKRKCPGCDGAKVQKCPACGGDPRIACTTCMATGTVPAPCDPCGGSGKRPCAGCSGTGKAREDCAACTEGKVIAACPACSGAKACPSCGGGGRKE